MTDLAQAAFVLNFVIPQIDLVLIPIHTYRHHHSLPQLSTSRYLSSQAPNHSIPSTNRTIAYSSQFLGHVPPVLPDGKPYSQALPITPGPLLPDHRPLCSANSPKSPVFSTIQHAARAPSWHHGDVGSAKFITHQETARERISLRVPSAPHVERSTAYERACS